MGLMLGWLDTPLTQTPIDSRSSPSLALLPEGIEDALADRS